MNLAWDKKISAALYRATKRSAILRPLAMFCATSLLFVMMAAFAMTYAGFDEMTPIMNRFFFAAMIMGVPLFLSWFVSYVLQHLTRRPRPFEAGQGEPLITMTWIGPSFPSAHTALAFATAMIGQVIFPSIFGVWLFVGATLVALGRVAVGVHYFLDAIVGAIIGALVGYFALAGLLRIIFMSGTF
jgi:membrane-associated phospholipid phosphatase